MEAHPELARVDPHIDLRRTARGRDQHQQRGDGHATDAEVECKLALAGPPDQTAAASRTTTDATSMATRVEPGERRIIVATSISIFVTIIVGWSRRRQGR